MPRQPGDEAADEGAAVTVGSYEHLGTDILSSVKEELIGHEGMKIDRMFYYRQYTMPMMWGRGPKQYIVTYTGCTGQERRRIIQWRRDSNQAIMTPPFVA